MKNWTKPSIVVISSEMLIKHIKVAARSGVCWGDFSR